MMDQSNARRSILPEGVGKVGARKKKASTSESVLHPEGGAAQAVTPLTNGGSESLPDDRLAFLRSLVRREQQTRWGAFGFSPEWSFKLAPIQVEGENASKYLVTFFSKEETPQRTMFLKQYHHPRIDGATVENEFYGIEVAERAFQQTERFRVPQAYSFDRAEKVLFMEYCPSVSLKQALFRPLRFSRFHISKGDRDRLLKQTADTGRLLSYFQHIPVDRHPKGRTETAAEVILRYKTQLLRHLRTCRKVGFPEKLIQQIQSVAFDRIERQSPLPPIALQHSDFAPWNLMVGERFLYLADFQNFTVGFPAYDAAFFYCALDLLFRYRTVDHRLLSRMQSTFLESYLNRGAESGSIREKGLETEALSLFHVFRLMHMTYFAQSVFCSPPVSFSQSLYAIPFRRFFTDWFDRYLAGE